MFRLSEGSKIESFFIPQVTTLAMGERSWTALQLVAGWGLSPREAKQSEIGYALSHSQQCTLFSLETQEICL